MVTDDLTPTLIARLRAGDESAAVALNDLYRAPLVAFATRYLRDAHAAEDAIQEVFLKALAAESVPENFRPWIYRVARNHILNVQRARTRRKDNERIGTRFDAWRETIGALTRFSQAQSREEMSRLLGDLPEPQQEVIYLRYSAELSRAEIAHVLEVPESTVKSRLFAGVSRLRDALRSD